MRARSYALCVATVAGVLMGAAPAASAPIALHAASVEESWSAAARVRAYVASTPAAILVSQRTPEPWDAALAGRWGIILPTRAMDRDGGCTLDYFVNDWIIKAPDGGLRWRSTGEPNCALTAEFLYASTLDRLALDPDYIVVDEVATGTMRTVTDFVRIVDRKANAGDADAHEIRRRLGFYVVAGDGVRPGRFPAYLRRFLTRTKAPVWGELYGGAIAEVQRRDRPGLQNGRQVRGRLKGTAIRIMRRNLRWNVRPMLSAAPRHVGTGRASILNLRQRIRFVRYATGMRPAVWKLNGAHHQTARGLGYMVTRALAVNTNARRAAADRRSPAGAAKGAYRT